MLNKIRSFMDQYAILASIVAFVVVDLLLHGLGRLLSLLPETLTMQYFAESVLIIFPIAIVCFFGFSRAFKKGNFWRGLLYGLPLIVLQLIALAVFFSKNLGNPETNWLPWYLIVYGVFYVVGIGIREECIYRATLQNIVAKKYANSVKGIWITVIVSSLLFGLCHVSNLFFGVEPLAVLDQVISAAVLGLLFGAIYLRSGNIWVLILIHTLTDLAGLSGSTFLRNVSDVEEMNRQATSFSVTSLIFWLIYIGLAAYLLRPSKCKEICESLCFAEKEPEETTRT